MKELFAKAVQKMKRKDFLDGFIKEKTAEEAKLTAEAGELRKKNGKKVGSDLDFRIFQINMRKSEIFKLIAKCKAEVKTLKSEILELLIECYSKAEKPENKAKIESACRHAFENKIQLLSDKDAGGILGDCKIVGAIVTHDKKKKFTTAKLVKAGAKNSQGKILHRPEIVVYDYDKKKEEGIYRDETDDFKKNISRKRQNPAFLYLKETYAQKNILFALGVTAIYALFALWSALCGFGQRVFSPLQLRFVGTLVTILGLFTLSTLKKGKKGGVCDLIPLTAIFISVVAYSCLFAYDIKRGIIFPTGLLLYGITAIILRAKFATETNEKEERSICLGLSLISGVLCAIVMRILSSAGPAYMITAFSFIGAIALISIIGCILKRGSEQVKLFKYLAIFIMTFGFSCFLLEIKLILGIVLFAVGTLAGFITVFTEKEDV